MSGTVYGVTPTGFVLKPVQQLLTEITGDLLGMIDPTTDVSPNVPLGQLLGIMAKKLGEVWQLAQVAYNATNRADAEDALLDNIGLLTGTIRNGETPSSVQCTATFSAAGMYAVGSLVAFPAPPGANTAQFSNATAITVPNLGGDGANAPSTTNTWPSLSGSAGILTAAGGSVTLTGTGSTTIPGTVVGQSITIAGSATPANDGTFTITASTDSSITWANAVGASDASGAVVWIANPVTTFLFNSIAAGPTSGDALVGAGAAYAAANEGAPSTGQLNQMVPVAGWASVADVGTVTVGTLEELDPPYRIRQYQELSAPGADTIDAIEADVLQALSGLSFTPSAQVYENTSPTTNANGLPPHSFMVVVFDANPSGTALANQDQLIQTAIWQNKPAGIRAYGLYTPPVGYTDASGVVRSVPFTRSAQVQIYVAMTIAVAGGTTSTQQGAIASAVATAITNATQGDPFTMYGSTVVPQAGAVTTFAPGQDVILNALKSIVQGQAGVIDVPSFTLGIAPAPMGTANLHIAINQNASLPGANIGIAFTTFVP